MKEEDLKKYIEFTKALLTQLYGNPKYTWFFESFNSEIISKFSQGNTNQNVLDKFKNITESDVVRIKSYLNFIDKNALKYGREFYREINDEPLKKELVKDYKAMKIALKNEDIVEFGRRLYLQIENIYNFSLSKLNIHNLINSNKEKYSKISFQWSDRARSYDYNFCNSFFAFNKETSEYFPVELSKISFNTKSVFLLNHFNFRINKFNLDDIYFLRNKGSHRGELSQDETKKLNSIKDGFDKNYSFYHKVLFDIVNGIKNIK